MAKSEEIDWRLVSSIRASQRRTQVLKALNDEPMMNGELANELDISTAWARRQVKWLKERGLVQDLTESKPNYKLYGVTDEGEKIAEEL